MIDLKGRVGLVTGSATGAGAATAIALAERGAGVCINYSRSQKDAEETLAKVKALGVPATIFKADVSDRAQCAALVAHTVAELGRLDVLVNNAGMTHFVPHTDLDGMSSQKWDDILEVNLKGPFYVAAAALPHLQKSDGAAIVNISSLAGIVGSGSSIAYAASKGALITLTQSLARAFAPEVRVNALAPGVILTRWVEGNDEFVQQYIDATAVKKACPPESIAHAAIFLIESEVITGQTVVMDGGLTLG
jgi:3-oxoacyl-[acyl-carrier protein] reductase